MTTSMTPRDPPPSKDKMDTHFCRRRKEEGVTGEVVVVVGVVEREEAGRSDVLILGISAAFNISAKSVVNDE